MAPSIDTPEWTAELPEGWDVQVHEAYVAVRTARGADLRFTSFAPEGGDPDAASRWVEAAAHFDRLKGRRVAPAVYGDFRGYRVEFTAGALAVCAWALVSGELPLDITYRCDAEQAGTEDAELDAALHTLRRAAG